MDSDQQQQQQQQRDAALAALTNSLRGGGGGSIVGGGGGSGRLGGSHPAINSAAADSYDGELAAQAMVSRELKTAAGEDLILSGHD